MASTEQFNLNTVLSLQTEEFKKGVEAANKQSQKMQKNFKSANKDISDSFLSLGKSLAAPLIGLASIGTIISFGKASVEAAEKSEVANKRLLKALNGNVSAFNELSRYADQLRLKTGVSGSSIKQIEMLAVGAGYGTDKIKKLVSASIELSSITGKDLQASYMMLNKTLSGSAGRLAMVDPAFKSLTSAQLKNGDAIDLVIKKFGGMAEISATSSQKLASDWTKFQVSFGKNLLGTKNGLLDFADAIVKGITPTKDIAREMETERQKVNSLATALQDHNLPLSIRRDYLIQLNQIAPEIVKNQNAEKLNYDKLTASLTEYNKQTVNRILLERQSAKLTASVNRGVDIKEQLESKNTQLGSIVSKYLSVDNRINKGIKDELTAKFNKDHDLAAYAQGLSDNIEKEIKKKTPGYVSTNGATLKVLNDIKILTNAFNANQSLNETWQKANDTFSKKNGLLSTPTKTGNTGTGDPAKGETAKEKAESNYQKLITISADLDLKLNKEVAQDEISKKNAEVDGFIEGEKRKISAIITTGDTQIKAKKAVLAKLESLKGRIGNGSQDITKMEPITAGVNTVSTGDSHITTLTGQFGQLHTKITEVNEAVNTYSKFMQLGGATTEDTAQRLGALSNMSGDMASMFGEQTAAYKLFATAQVTLSTITGANAAAASMAWLPGAAPVVMGLYYAMGAAQIAKINGVKFAGGGIVPGASYSGDKIHAFVNSGEMILNGNQQANLFSMLKNGAGNDSSDEIRLRVSGTDLVGVLYNHNRKLSKTR